MNSNKQSNKIIISGFYGRPNLGDEAICWGIIEGLKKYFCKQQIVIITTSQEVSRSFTCSTCEYIEGNYPNWRFWRSLKKLLSNIRQSKLVLIGGGGLFQDVHNCRTPLGHLLIGCLGLSLGVPVCTIGLGVGPFKRTWIAMMTGYLTNKFSLVMVRDQYSMDTLLELGVDSHKIFIGADIAAGFLGRKFEDYSRNYTKNLIGISLRPWPGVDISQHAELFENLVKTDKKLSLLCCEMESDANYYNEILDLCSDDTRKCCEIFIPSKVENAIEEIGQTEFFIAMRLHACVLCAVQGVPFIPVSYAPKVKSFSKDYGIKKWIVDVEVMDSNVYKKIPIVSQSIQKNKTTLKRNILKMSLQWDSMFKRLVNYNELKVNIRDRIAGLFFSIFLLFLGFIYELFRVLMKIIGRGLKILNSENIRIFKSIL